MITSSPNVPAASALLPTLGALPEERGHDPRRRLPAAALSILDKRPDEWKRGRRECLRHV